MKAAIPANTAPALTAMPSAATPVFDAVTVAVFVAVPAEPESAALVLALALPVAELVELPPCVALPGARVKLAQATLAPVALCTTMLLLPKKAA
jgi:hypothetical protein